MELLSENYITKMLLKRQELFFYPQEVILRADIKIKRDCQNKCYLNNKNILK